MPTIFIPTPKKSVSLKSLGAATSDPTNPQLGTDITGLLGTIANDTTSYNTIVCDGGVYKGRVRLPSSRGIQGLGARWKGPGYPVPKTGLIHPQSSAFCVTNSQWTTDVLTSDGTDAGTTIESTLFSQIIDQDITIRDLFIHGNFGHAAGNSAYDPTNSLTTFFGTDPFGVLYGLSGQSNQYTLMTFNGVTIALLIQPIHIHGVRNLVMENCSFYYPPATCVLGSYIDGAYISNLHCYNPLALTMTVAGVTDTFGAPVGGTPLEFDGTCRGLRLYGISGGAQDDAIAFNAWNGGGNSSHTGTAQKAGYATYFLNYIYANGPQTDITIDGMDLYAAEAVLRFLAGGSRGTLDGITVNNVRATAFGAIIRMDNAGSPAATTPIGKICLSNFNIDTVIDPAYTSGATHTGSMEISQAINTLILNNFAIKDSGNMAAHPMLNIDASRGVVTNLIVNGMMSDGHQSMLAVSAGTLTNCVVGNSIHINHSDNSSIYTTGGTPGILSGAGNIGVTAGGGTNWSDKTKFSSA